jgi:predicted secreted protein
MHWTSFIAIYFVTWFLVLFGVLPFGVRTQDDAKDRVLGTPESAPVNPRLVRTAVITTVITTFLCAGYYYVYAVLGINTVWLAKNVSF